MDHHPPVIVRVELEHVQHQLRAALHDYQGEIKALAFQAIEEELKPERVLGGLRALVRDELKAMLRREIETNLRNYVVDMLKDHVASFIQQAAYEQLGMIRTAVLERTAPVNPSRSPSSGSRRGSRPR